MSIFVDTSALLALIDADDRHHSRAKKVWKTILPDQQTLVTTNYVLLETFSVAQTRLGLPAARTIQESFFPLLTTQWVDNNVHESGVTAVLAAGRRRLSLVDCISFETMRRLGIRSVFTFDKHFRDQGFDCLPGYTPAGRLKITYSQI